jgi:hypothetical protein
MSVMTHTVRRTGTFLAAPGGCGIPVAGPCIGGSDQQVQSLLGLTSGSVLCLRWLTESYTPLIYSPGTRTSVTLGAHKCPTQPMNENTSMGLAVGARRAPGPLGRARERGGGAGSRPRAAGTLGFCRPGAHSVRGVFGCGRPAPLGAVGSAHNRPAGSRRPVLLQAQTCVGTSGGGWRVGSWPSSVGTRCIRSPCASSMHGVGSPGRPASFGAVGSAHK